MNVLYALALLCAACVARADPVIVNPQLDDDASPPLSSVIVAQCGNILVIYLTTVEGKLIRYDEYTNIPVKVLLSVADSAKNTEVVVLHCPGTST